MTIKAKIAEDPFFFPEVSIDFFSFLQ